MESGDLVPDSMILELVGKRLRSASAGYILDGFPRTVSQARALDSLLEDLDGGLDLVIALDIDDEAIVARLKARRSCPGCGRVYNLRTAPPKVEGICDFCGGSLVKRDDDTDETIRERLKVYRSQTEPLRDYYAERGILKVVDGIGGVDQVYDRVKSSIVGLT
jgi:adenylate kinase